MSSSIEAQFFTASPCTFSPRLSPPHRLSVTCTPTAWSRNFLAKRSSNLHVFYFLFSKRKRLTSTVLKKNNNNKKCGCLQRCQVGGEAATQLGQSLLRKLCRRGEVILTSGPRCDGEKGRPVLRQHPRVESWPLFRAQSNSEIRLSNEESSLIWPKHFFSLSDTGKPDH